MDYEKKYKEALERAKDYHNQLIDEDNSEWAGEIENIFPELKESEDDRISREITEFILTHRIDEPNDIEDTNSWLAWLEKQGKKKLKWTEKDEKIIRCAISFLIEFRNKGYENAVACIDWLESIKQRMEEQQ